MVLSKVFGFNQYGNVDVFQEKELDVTLTEKKTVLIRVERTSVNPFDIAARSGQFAKNKPLETFKVLGNEVQGEVVELGEISSNLNVGDKVIALLPSGGDAEYVATAEKNVFKIPKGMCLDVAASFPMVSEAALWTLDPHFYELKDGDTLGIVGASGSVGSVILQLAREKNIKIIAVGSQKNAEYLKELGADSVVDYRNEKDILTHQNEADYVINASLFNQGEDVAIALVKDKGTILGLNSVPDVSSKPGVTGMVLNRTKDMTNQRAMPRLLAFYEKYGIQVKIGYQLPLSLDGVKQAHELFEGKKQTGKILLVRE